MKKQLYFFILGSLMTSFSAFAQNNAFGPQAAQWWEDGIGNNYQVGPENHVVQTINYYTVSGDTVIDGQQAGIIQQKIYSRNTASNNGQNTVAVSSSASTNLYFYANPDTVFIYNQNFKRFTPLYVFNVQKGDTVCLPALGEDLRPNPYANGDTCFCFVIDSIRTVLYDTSYLQTYYEHSLVGDSLNWGAFPIENWGDGYAPFIPTGSYAHKIGATFGGLLPVNVTNAVQKPTTDSFLYQSNNAGLRCYQEDNLAIHIQYSTDFGCLFDTTSTLGLTPLLPLENLIQIYPNPADKTIHINLKKAFSDDAKLYLNDVLGRQIKAFIIKKGNKQLHISVKDLPSGVYYLQVVQNQKRYSEKVIISR